MKWLRTPKRNALILVLLVILAGLVRYNVKPAPAPKPAPKPIERTRSIGKAVTEAEAEALAEELEAAVDSGDEAEFDRLVDWAAMDWASTSGVAVSESLRIGFIRGLEQGRREQHDVWKGIAGAVDQGGGYTLLHNHVEDGRRRLLFRLEFPEAGLNYHDLILARREDGKVRVVDLKVFITGELFTETIRRLFLQAVALRSTNLLDRLTGADRKQVQFFDKVNTLNQARKDEQFARVLEIYRSCPPELQKDKAILMTRLLAAQKLGDEAEENRTVDDFRAAYPGDPAIDLLSIDAEISRKHYAEALACVDRLDKAVLGDPYLETFRAAIHMEQEDYDAARADVRRALESAPDLEAGYWTAVSIELKAKDHARTLQALRQVRDRFHYQFGDLSQDETYREFSQSPEGLQWAAETKPAPPAETPEAPKP